MAKQNIKDPGAHHNSSGALIRRFLPYLAKYKAVLFLDLFCAALTTLCDIFLPKIMSTITNSAMGVGITLTTGIVLKLAGIYFVLRIIDGAAQYFMSGIGHIMGVHIETDMRRDAFDHLLLLDHTYYNNTKVGTIMGRITNDLFDVTEFAHHCPEEFFIAFIKILASFIILCQASIPLTLAVFACVPLMGVVSVYLNGRLRARFRQQRIQIGELNATIEDSLLGQGVVKAFAEMIAGKVKSPRSVKLATWFIGLFTIDDYMSPLLRGVVMRPLTDEMRVPREKLAFLLDSTCASVCTLMPFMAWGAYVAGLVADLGGPVTSNEQGVSVYISAIPFNFYAILMVLITLLSALEIFPDFGPMRKAEQRARTTGKLLRDGAVPMMGTELEELQKGNDSDVKPNVMLDFLIPIIILVATAIWTYIAKGGVKILECFIITVIYMSIELSIRKVFKSVTDLVNTAVQGMKSVMSATLILALAYCINTITKSMGAADFLLGVCESWMTPALFLSVAFIAGSVISFFTGSSWGTFAICIPIAVPMAYSFTGGQLGTLVYAAVGAVVSGGLFGDHCSPVSDTTVLSSLGAACDHIDHVRTQLPYALLAAAVSIILWIVVALVGGAV